jgi:SAM-dependent methyltransferase
MNSGVAEPVCVCCGESPLLPQWNDFLICPTCGVMRYQGGCTNEFLKTIYTQDYYQGKVYIDYEADAQIHKRTLQGHLFKVDRHLPKGGRLLELGCATGHFLELARRRYPNPLGIDISGFAVSQCRKKGLNALEGDFKEMAIQERFDAVCMWDTIEHLAQPREVLEKIASVLRPGGCLFLTTGDLGSWLARVQGVRWRQIHPPEHLFYFTKGSLRAICAQSGMEVVQFQYVTVYHHVGNSLKQLQRLGPGRFSGRIAGRLLRWLPRWLLDWTLPVRLFDTVFLVARKRA